MSTRPGRKVPFVAKRRLKPTQVVGTLFALSELFRLAQRGWQVTIPFGMCRSRRGGSRGQQQMQPPELLLVGPEGLSLRCSQGTLGQSRSSVCSWDLLAVPRFLCLGLCQAVELCTVQGSCVGQGRFEALFGSLNKASSITPRTLWHRGGSGWWMLLVVPRAQLDCLLSPSLSHGDPNTWTDVAPGSLLSPLSMFLSLPGHTNLGRAGAVCQGPQAQTHHAGLHPG